MDKKVRKGWLAPHPLADILNSKDPETLTQTRLKIVKEMLRIDPELRKEVKRLLVTLL